MTTLLRISTSIFDNQQEQGVSTQLSNQLIEKLLTVHPELRIVDRDFAKDPVPHLNNVVPGFLQFVQVDEQSINNPHTLKEQAA